MNTDNTVKLQSGSWQALIDPQHGMNVISLRENGEEILRTPDDDASYRARSELYGIPLLLPPNRTEKGLFNFDGKQYKLPVNEPLRNNHLNGFLHDAQFKICQKGSDYIEAEYNNNGEIFPFLFEIKVQCVVSNSGLKATYTFTNTGKTDMPLTFGIHTAFKAASQMCIPICKRWVTNTNYIPTGELAELTKFEQELITGTDPCQLEILGFYTTNGHQAQIGRFKYTVSDNFDGWVLWNQGGGKGFVCIEPQRGAPNALNNGFGLIRLKPKACETFEISITEMTVEN